MADDSSPADTAAARGWRRHRPLVLLLLLLAALATMAAARAACTVAAAEAPWRLLSALDDGSLLAVFNTAGPFGDSAATIVYEPGASGGAADRRSAARRALEAARGEIEAPRRVLVLVCAGDAVNTDRPPPPATCDVVFWRSPHGEWRLVEGDVESFLAAAAADAAHPFEQVYATISRGFVACARGDADAALAAFDLVVASSPRDEPIGRRLAAWALVEATRVRADLVLQDAATPSPRALRRLTRMTRTASRTRCELQGAAIAYPIYDGITPSPTPEAPPASVNVVFAIDAGGRPFDVEVVRQSVASSDLARLSQERVASKRYLAACADGRPVTTVGVEQRLDWGSDD